MSLRLENKSNGAIGRLRRNLARLTTGSVLSQAILALSTPLLTRLYAPDAFGVAALFAAAYALLIPLVTLKFDQVVVQPQSSRIAASIGALVMMLATVNCSILGLVFFAWYVFSQGQHHLVFFFLPVALWIGAAYTLMQQWSSRLSNYTYYARSQVIGAICNVCLCVGAAAAFSPDSVYIVLGFVAGIGVALGYTVWGFKEWPYSVRVRRLRVFKRQILSYKKFPLFVLPTSLVIVVGANGVPFVISHFYSTAEVGIFAIANRVLLIPAAIIGGSLAEAVRSEFASRQRARERVTPVFINIIIPIIALAGGVFAIIYLIPSSAFQFVFGQDYGDTGGIVQSLLLATFSQFICAPFVYVFAILREPGRGLLSQILITLLPLCALITFASRGNPLSEMLFIYSLCTFAGGVVMLALAYRECKIYDKNRRA